mmetsp:Transcript_36358/g.109571  ORF Transcript_36358/g.109571 Transcript_36358/m.109571 type:complete len:315 (-) Transcript_36358:479-1423(-)
MHVRLYLERVLAALPPPSLTVTVCRTAPQPQPGESRAAGPRTSEVWRARRHRTRWVWLQRPTWEEGSSAPPSEDTVRRRDVHLDYARAPPHADGAGGGAAGRRHRRQRERVGGRLQHVLERLLEHLAGEGVVGLERERLVVQLDGSVRVASQVVREAERGVRRRVARRDGEREPVPFDGLVETAHLAAGVAEVKDGGLPCGVVVVALVLCDAREVVCSLGVLAARVVQHAQLVEYGGLVRRDGVRLFDVVHRERQVVGAQVLHPDAEPRSVRARKEARRGAVGGHRLVRLVLRRKRVAEANPGRSEAVVEGGCL